MKRTVVFLVIMSIFVSLFSNGIMAVSASTGVMDWPSVWSDSKPLTWLVAGDSITSDNYVGSWKTYDDYISYALNVEKGKKVNFIKTAVPGYKVIDLNDKFDNLIGRYKSDIVSVFIGTNDGADASAKLAFKANLQSLMDKMVPSTENIAGGVPSDRMILLLGTIPKKTGTKFTTIIDDTIAVASQYSSAGYRVQYIDLNSIFDNLVYGTPPNLSALADYFVSTDPYHLNGYGHLQVAKKILGDIGLQDSSVFELKASEIDPNTKAIPYFAFDYAKADKKSDGTAILTSLTSHTDYSSLCASNAYKFFVTMGGSAAVTKGAAGPYKNFDQLLRYNARYSYNTNRFTNMSGTGYSASALAANIDTLLNKSADTSYVFVMPEIYELYVGDGTGIPTIEEYKQYVQTIVNAIKAKGLPFTLLTPVPSKNTANNAILQQYADAAIGVVEAAKLSDSTLKAGVCNVFNVLKDAANDAVTAQNWFDGNGYWVDSAQNVMYNAFMDAASSAKVIGMFDQGQLLESAKTAALNELTAALQNYQQGDYTAESWTQLNAAKTAGDTAIRGATAVDNVTIEKNKALAAMKKVKTIAQLGIKILVSNSQVLVSSPVNRTAAIVAASFNGSALTGTKLFDNMTLAENVPQILDVSGLPYISLSQLKFIARENLLNTNNTIFTTYAGVDTGNVSVTPAASMLFPDSRKKALTFSYDDGVIQDRQLAEIFNRYGVKATFNIPSAKLGASVSGNATVNPNEVGTLYANHEVAGHGYTHTDFTSVTGDTVKSLIQSDKDTLRQLTGYDITGLAYPAGRYNDAVVQAVGESGIQYARTITTGGNFNIPANFLTWAMTCHHDNANLFNYANDFMADDGNVKLFSIWGHSYEFDANQNWNRIEDLCTQLSNHPEIWYATNGEIVRYVNAYRKLVFYDKNSYVFNPSDEDVYININNENKRVAANSFTVLGGTAVDPETFTDSQLVEATAAASIEKLNSVFASYNQSEYIPASWQTLTGIKEAGENSIRNSTTVDEISSVLSQTIDEMDAVTPSPPISIAYNNPDVTVTTPVGKTATLVVASYYKNNMIDVKLFKDITFEANVPRSFDVGGLRTMDTGAVKVFLWNSMEERVPITISRVYNKGNVLFTANGSIDGGADKLVTIAIKDSAQKIIYLDEGISGANGKYSFRIKIPETAPTGTYTVIAGEKGKNKSSSTFNILR